jgi:hypothetical protein
MPAPGKKFSPGSGRRAAGEPVPVNVELYPPDGGM